MPRPVDTQRREALLDAAVDYVVEHGLAGVSLRPLAAALGTDAPVLLHHFRSKDNLLVLLLNRVRDRLRTLARSATGDDPSDQLGAVWEWTSDPRHEALFRLFFEAYGLALQNPDRYAEFLDHVVEDWLGELAPAVGADRATLAVAAVRGLLLDLLTTGDRDRVEAAERLLLSLLRPA
jgi:AcrR family transcriptional regulator